MAEARRKAAKLNINVLNLIANKVNEMDYEEFKKYNEKYDIERKAKEKEDQWAAQIKYDADGAVAGIVVLAVVGLMYWLGH